MTSQMESYKAELSQRYWEYRRSKFPAGQAFFDQPHPRGVRPPVFCVGEAWRNVIVKPNASQQETDRLLGLVSVLDRHKLFGSMNSSQALAQSVLGNLAIHGLLSSLTELLDDNGMTLFGKAQILDNFAMEFKADYLGEPRRTSLDGYIGGDYRLAIECKFTEPDVGTCSRPRLTPADSKYASEHCNRTYSKQRTRKARCTLTELGVLYWQYVTRLFCWNSDQDLSPCPLDANYQLVRNILAIGVRPSGEVSSTDGHVVLIYDERNPAFQEGGKGFRAFAATRLALREPAMLRKCSWQRVIQYMRNEGTLPWLTEQLALKYGL